MVQFNTRANEIVLKLVYYGPGLSGKTTNLQSLHAMCMEGNRGELFSVNTQEDRTLFFDLLPINLGYIYGNAIHIQIYTVPGQVQYDASRRVVLGGADGIVFVADSSEAKMQENVDSLSNLYHNLNANRLNIKQIPFVIQFNKRDVQDAMPVGVMNRRLNFRNVPFFEAIAPRGTGVLETFLSIATETVGTTFRKYHLDKKIKDFDEMLNLINTNIRATMREQPPPPAETNGVAKAEPEATVLRHSHVSVADLVPGKVVDAQDLLEDALKSNMETARLYSELKQAKESIEKKSEELGRLYAQLERANQDNLKTRRYLEGLIQSVAEAIISFGADGRILTWNVAAERIFGYARAEIVGRTMQQLTPASHAGELEQAIAQVEKGQLLRDVTSVRLRKDGTEFPALITYAPIKGTDDRVLAYSALVRDLGEQDALVRRVKALETNAVLSKIMPAIFNDLANRLAPIYVQVGTLMGSGLNPSQENDFGKLLRAVDSVQTLLRPLLMVLAPCSPRPVLTQLNTIVKEAAKRLDMEAAACGVGLDYALDPALPECGLDQDQVRDAITYLICGQIYSSTKSSAKRVKIGTRRVENMIQFISQDTGPAIPEADRAFLFEITGAKDQESLGIAVAASVVKDHGGKINFRSQNGSGNVFLLEFPMTTPSPSTNGTQELQGKKVLVVDDEDFLLECIVDAITAWGCEVTPASKATEAIPKLQSGSFDLIVSDVRMPGLTGMEFFEWIKANQPNMARRILFTTGDSFDPGTRAFLERDHLPHLGKPFDLKRLKQSLVDLLADSSR